VLPQDKSNKNKASRIFWTSGADSGCRNKFAWCGPGQMLDGDLLQKVDKRDDQVFKNCLLLNHEKQGAPLVEEFCAEKNRWICEGTEGPKFSIINDPVCPDFTCKLNVITGVRK